MHFTLADWGMNFRSFNNFLLMTSIESRNLKFIILERQENVSLVMNHPFIGTQNVVFPYYHESHVWWMAFIEFKGKNFCKIIALCNWTFLGCNFHKLLLYKSGHFMRHNYEKKNHIIPKLNSLFTVCRSWRNSDTMTIKESYLVLDFWATLVQFSVLACFWG